MSLLCPDVFTRDHHCPDHDYTQYHCQEIPSKSLLCDCNGPVRLSLLHLRVCRAHRVRHAALLCQQQEAQCQKGQEKEKPGKNWSEIYFKKSISLLYYSAAKTNDLNPAECDSLDFLSFFSCVHLVFY